MAPQKHTDDTAGIIDSVEPYIRSAVRHLPKHEREDAAQDVRLHLLAVSIPRYTAARGDLKTYLFRCITNAALERGRQLSRQRKTFAIDDYDRAAPDQSADRLVEQLAAMILDAPDQHMSAAKARLLRAVVENPELPRGAVAELLGVDVSHVWAGLSRLRSEIVKFAHARCA